jgi:hypothetical protein
MSAGFQDKENVKMLQPVQQTRAKQDRLREFTQGLHGIEFIKDPRLSAVAIVHDPLAPNVQRVLQWIKLRAFGGYSMYCVTDNGQLASASDCARELNIDRSSVCRTLKYLETRGYIMRHGPSKKIYPVPNPKPVRTPERLGESKTAYAAFAENWAAANSSEFERLTAARARVDEIRRQMWKEYRAQVDVERNADHRNGISLVPAKSPEPIKGVDPLPPEIKAAFDAVIPSDALYSPRTAAALVSQARRQAQAAGETVTDGEIARAIDAAAQAASGRGVRHIGFFKTALPEKIEALIEERRAEVKRAAELAKKCPACRGSRRDPVFPQDDCRTCNGTGLPSSA